MQPQSFEDIVARIREIQDELKKLDVRREYINFRRLRPEELTECLESVREQLKTRKRFLGSETDKEF